MSFRQKANSVILIAFSVIFIAFSLRPAGLPYRYGHIVPHLPLPRITEKMISSVNVSGKELDAAQISEFVRLYNRSKVKGTCHDMLISPSTTVSFDDGSVLSITRLSDNMLALSFVDGNGSYYCFSDRETGGYTVVSLELSSFLYCVSGGKLSDMYC